MFAAGIIIGFTLGLFAGCIIFAIIVSRHDISKDIYDIINETHGE